MKVEEVLDVKANVINMADNPDGEKTYLRMFQVWNNAYVWYRWSKMGWTVLSEDKKIKELDVLMREFEEQTK